MRKPFAGLREGLRLEAADPPALSEREVFEAIVHAVRSPLPELPAVRGEEVAAPEVGERHGGVPWVGGRLGGEGRLKVGTRGDRFALTTGACAELALARTAREVVGRLGRGKASHWPRAAHLSLESQIGRASCRERVYVLV